MHLCYIGEICSRNNDDNSSDYTCQYIHNCKVVIKDIQKHIIPKLCSFNGSIPIVCCPPSDDANANTKIIPIGKFEPSVTVETYRTKADES